MPIEFDDTTGSRNRNAKINEDIARQIKELLRTGKSDNEVAEALSVSRSIVNSIRRNKRWTHVK